MSNHLIVKWVHRIYGGVSYTHARSFTNLKLVLFLGFVRIELYFSLSLSPVSVPVCVSLIMYPGKGRLLAFIQQLCMSNFGFKTYETEFWFILEGTFPQQRSEMKRNEKNSCWNSNGAILIQPVNPTHLFTYGWRLLSSSNTCVNPTKPKNNYVTSRCKRLTRFYRTCVFVCIKG